MINEATLANFIGSVESHTYSPKLVYTDGVKYVCEEGEAYWILDLINSYELHVKPVIDEEFQVWKLTVDLETKEGLMTCDDGNDGGFNRSSQHLNLGGVDDDRETEIGAVHKAQIVLARTAACLAA